MATGDGGETRRGDWPVAAAVFACFAACGFWRAPIPAVNEPHYFCKARHYWDPAWCPGDMFLDSTDVHVVFFATFGWLTTWLSLESAVLVGRIVGYVALAVGWTALVRRLAPGRWAPLWSATFFLAFAAVWNFSGEWIVGGIEGKVIAYAALWLALAWSIDRRPIRAAAALGVAISFHPIVGLWGLAAMLFAEGAMTLRAWLRRHDPQPGDAWRQPPPSHWALAALVLALTAAPGLWPAVEMLRASDPELAARADHIQVTGRLRHHLDPRYFPTRAYGGAIIAILIWQLLRFGMTKVRGERYFHFFVEAAIVAAAIGVWVGLRTDLLPHTRILKFYPFRMADAFIPIALAVALTTWLSQTSQTWPTVARRSLAGFALGRARWIHAGPHAAAAILRRLTSTLRMTLRAALPAFALAAFAVGFATPTVDSNPSRLNTEQQADLHELYRWIRAETPPDALFRTSRVCWAFKWYTARPEYVSHKDCPQDAAGIVEWNRRLGVQYRWDLSYQATFDDRPPVGYTAAALGELRAKTSVDYLITTVPDTKDVPPAFQNARFAVYPVKPEARE